MNPWDRHSPASFQCFRHIEHALNKGPHVYAKVVCGQKFRHLCVEAHVLEHVRALVLHSACKQAADKANIIRHAQQNKTVLSTCSSYNREKFSQIMSRRWTLDSLFIKEYENKRSISWKEILPCEFSSKQEDADITMPMPTSPPWHTNSPCS